MLLAVALLLGVSGVQASHEEFGLRFWKTLSTADLPAMERCYSPQVTLLAGSELLKKEWGLNPGGNRNQDLPLTRETLMAGYKLMIGKIGAEKWRSAFSKVGRDKISFVVAEKDRQRFKGVRQGDVLMKVATGPGDDALLFVLSQTTDKTWSVRMEATDY